MQCSSYEHQMESQKRQACTTVERRKKLAIFATLCAAAVLVIILVVVLLTMLKSENDKQEEYTFVRVFTNLGRVGHKGPINTNEYRETVLEKEVEVVDGIQLWNVPFSGVWYLEVYGASGGDGLYSGHNGRLKGGLGAKLTGKLKLDKGTVLKILVGQQGERDHLTHFRAGSGGGATFVVSSDDKPIMVAGGGGGGGVPKLGMYSVGGPGRKEYISKIGKGGHLFDPQRNITVVHVRHDHACMAGAGGGFHKDGAGYRAGWGGKAFEHGGNGGYIKRRKFDVMTGTSSSGYDKGGADGGFGGGGASGLLPGGGGGYTGGSVRGAYLYDKTYKVADGGTSYNVALYPTISPGVHKKHGRVFVKFLGTQMLPFNANQTTDPRIPRTREDWYKEAWDD